MRQRSTDRVALMARLLVALPAAALLAACGYLMLLSPVYPAEFAWNRPILGRPCTAVFAALVCAAAGLTLGAIALVSNRAAFKRKLNWFCAMAISVTVGVIVLDMIFAIVPGRQALFADTRLLWPQGQDFFAENDRYGFTGRPGSATDFEIGEKTGIMLPMVSPDKIVPTGETKFTAHIFFDENGFPNAEVPARADVLLAGDSFGMDYWIADGAHWIKIFQSQFGMTLYNTAVPGWEPLQQSRAIVDMIPKLKPRLVVWIFFEGNDLQEAEEFAGFLKFRQETGGDWLDFMARTKNLPPHRFPYDRPLARCVLKLGSLLNPPPGKPEGWNDLMPLTLEAAGRKAPQALYDRQFYQMSMGREAIERSVGWIETRRAFDEALKCARANSAKTVFIFFPSKSTVYWPLIREQADRAKLAYFSQWWLPENERLAPEALVERISANRFAARDLLAEFCRDNGAAFIDTSETLWRKTQSGDFPYWCYDSHINAVGNKVVSELLAAELRRLYPASED